MAGWMGRGAVVAPCDIGCVDTGTSYLLCNQYSSPVTTTPTPSPVALAFLVRSTLIVSPLQVGKNYSPLSLQLLQLPLRTLHELSCPDSALIDAHVFDAVREITVSSETKQVVTNPQQTVHYPLHALLDNRHYLTCYRYCSI